MSARFTPFLDLSVEELLTQILLSLENRQLVVAERLLRNALDQHPDEGRFWELLGTVLWCRGEQNEALASLETASAYRVLTPLSQIILADCYAKLGKPNLAFIILYFLTEEDRCPTALLSHLASALGRINEHYLAALIFARLVERVPTHHRGWHGLAYHSLRLGRSTESVLPFLRSAFELRPYCVTYRVNYGLALADLGRDEEAVLLLDQVHPQTIGCLCKLTRLSRFYRKLGDTIRYELFESRILELT